MLKRLMLIAILTVVLLCGIAEYDSRQLPNLINKVMPSVVYVEAPGQWRGSGVIVGPHIVLTARHIVRDANKLEIKTANKTYKAIHWVIDRDNDCALIFFDPRWEFKNIAEFADSDKLRVGESVFAIGSPFGRQLFNTVTSGIVSGIDRTILFFGCNGLVTSDTAINPGNSGGPVFNMQGKIIGIAVGMKVSRYGTEGLTIIIPSNVCRELLENE